jgi:phosphatidylserine/phosphatidylglycerophosphate/cardiolipin synthase-like enzyme
MRFRFKKHRRLILIYGALILASAFLSYFVFKVSSKSLTNFIKPKLKPAYNIEVTKPLESSFIFSNELDSVSLSEPIVEEINKASRTLEIALYSIKSTPIKKAIYAAYERGVMVTLIMDYRKKDVHDIFFDDLPVGINRIDLGSSYPSTILMHHKFALIDRGESNQKLIFGSFNWTDLQEKYDHSFIMLSSSSQLIESFGREFDRLAKNEFGPAKLNNKQYNPWDLNLTTPNIANDSLKNNYEVWFGPGYDSVNINYRIFELIREAKTEIRVMIWDFTNKFLAEELVRRAREGLKVTVLADSLNFYSPSSVFNYLLQEKKRLKLDNLEILTDPNVLMTSTTSEAISPEAPNPFLHYHVLITDNSKVLFGTNNWSLGGAYYNDEAAIVSDDQKIISVFQKSFNYNYQLNKEPR